MTKKERDTLRDFGHQKREALRGGRQQTAGQWHAAHPGAPGQPVTAQQWHAAHDEYPPSKRRPAVWKGIVGGLLLVVVMSAAFGLGGWWFTGLLAGWLGREAGVGIILLGNMLWYTVLGLLIWVPMHVKHYRHMGDAPQPNEAASRMGPWYDSLMEALDAIAAGDFDVLVQPSHYRHSYFDDIADRVNSMARELANMENARQDFVANVSHEIQSPLTSIEGFAALLEDDGLDEEKRRHYLEVIKTEAGRLSKLSDNLLKLSMLDASAGLEKQEYRLDRQLRDVMLLLEPQWSVAGVEVSLEAEETLVCAQQDMLEQVWINLLHNAIKFTPQGGHIDVGLQAVEGGVAVRVRDTGCGMPEAVRVHIFERFYKADKARERARGGNGLGLSIAHKIVTMHGGTMGVDSLPDVGSTFVVFLPSKRVKQ